MPIALDAVTHVNVNCSDLKSSLGFYRELIGLEASVHTHPAPQAGAAFGMSGEVQWDAHILHDTRGFAAPAIDLLEWKQPKPERRPAPEPHTLGLASVGFLVPDLDASWEKARSLGVRCLSEPAELPVVDGLSARLFHALDPDATRVEVAEQNQLESARFNHVTLQCRDVSRSAEWYERVLGLEAFGGVGASDVSGEAFGLNGPVSYVQRYLRVPGRDEFGLDLLEWERPSPVGRPAAAANQLGIYRVAFLVKDLPACVDGLRAQGVSCPDPACLDMGPDVPVEGVWAVFFHDPDGICLELIEVPRVAD